MPLISLAGRIGSGKSLMANIFDQLGYDEYTFASPLKEIAVIFGFNENHVNGSQQDKLIIDPDWGCSSREWLQKFGTEVCREQFKILFPNSHFPYGIWAYLMEKEYKYRLEVTVGAPYCMCVSDNRFVNEAECIKKNSGHVIKIIGDRSDDHKSNHRSEVEIDLIEADFTIVNNKDTTIQELVEQAVKILKIIDPDRTSLKHSDYATDSYKYIIKHVSKDISKWIEEDIQRSIQQNRDRQATVMSKLIAELPMAGDALMPTESTETKKTELTKTESTKADVVGEEPVKTELMVHTINNQDDDDEANEEKEGHGDKDDDEDDSDNEDENEDANENEVEDSLSSSPSCIIL